MKLEIRYELVEKVDDETPRFRVCFMHAVQEAMNGADIETVVIDAESEIIEHGITEENNLCQQCCAAARGDVVGNISSRELKYYNRLDD